MKPLAILHEGTKDNADCQLIKLLIKHLQLDEHRVDFYAMGPKSNFFKVNEAAYKDLKQKFETDILKKLLFVIDADDAVSDHVYGGFENTNKALNVIVRELGFQEINSVFIMCDPDTKKGYLESFILSTIPDDQKSCIQSFLACSNFSSKENHKAILNKIYNMAYPNTPYDFDHVNFDLLKTRLMNLFNSY